MKPPTSKQRSAYLGVLARLITKSVADEIDLENEEIVKEQPSGPRKITIPAPSDLPPTELNMRRAGTEE